MLAADAAGKSLRERELHFLPRVSLNVPLQVLSTATGTQLQTYSYRYSATELQFLPRVSLNVQLQVLSLLALLIHQYKY